MTCGIYRLEINNKYYIGKDTKIDKSQRYKHHRSLLRNNKHFNRHLQRAFNKYGYVNYDVLIEFGIKNEDQLNIAEMFYIDLYDAMESGFNQTKGGEGVTGRKVSLEEIERVKQKKLKGFQEGIYSTTTGEKDGMHILTEKQVKEIVSEFYIMKKSDKELASIYGVSRQTINYIRAGKRWSYLKEVQDWLEFKRLNAHKLRPQGDNTLFPLEAYEIKQLLKYGFKMGEIASFYNISKSTVRKIKQNKSYTDVDITKPHSYYKL